MSVLHAGDWGEWQAAVYLLTGCYEAWKELGARVLEERSIAPMIDELEDGKRGWSSGERRLLEWVAHFWDIARPGVCFPYGFDEEHFHRWVAACHLRKHLAPQAEGGVR